VRHPEEHDDGDEEQDGGERHLALVGRGDARVFRA
jgi:hypothetical protein